MFNFFKKKNPNDFVDEKGRLLEKSAIVHSKYNERFLKLNDEDCAIVIHSSNNVEVVFSKLYDKENQPISENEEALMALALFIKQPGFLELVKNEFRKIAQERINALTNEK